MKNNMNNLIFKPVSLLQKSVLFIIFIIFIFMPETGYGQTEIENFKNSLRRLGYSESQILQKLKDSGYLTEEEGISSGIPLEKEGAVNIDSLIKIQEQIITLQQELLSQKELIEVSEDELKPFGYDIFNWIPTSFEPPVFGSITPDYIIGPGDEIRLEMWGQTSMSESFVVDREGNVFIDKLGKITVNGLTFEQLKNRISRKLKNFYSQSFVDVSLGKIRSIHILVSGQVKAPGVYWLSSLSPVYSALYFAGGATSNGSLRNIELIRDKNIDIIDFYNLQLKGEFNKNIRLREGDIIIVPPVGKRVSLSGEIKVPAIYELKPGEVLEDVVNIAGKFKSDAYLKKLQIWRIIPSEQRTPDENDRKLIDINYLREDEKRTKLFDGDSIYVHSIIKQIENYVEVIGFVKRPGLYEYKNDMTLTELLKLCDGVLDEAYLERANIIRTLHDTGTVLIDFVPKKILNNLNSNINDNIALNKKDIVRIYSKWEVTEKDSIEIFGEVKEPGKYELYDDLTLSNLIFLAGGLTESAYKHLAEVSRTSSDNTNDNELITTIYFNLNNGEEVENFKLKKYDNIFIRRDPNWKLQKNVEIDGEVVMPGVYSLKSKNDRLSDLIERAGGLKETAYPDGIYFNRKVDSIGIVDIDLEKILKNNSDPGNIVLMDSDYVYIPGKINTVRVEGEIGLPPRSVLYQNGKGADYYVNAAGGYTDMSDRKRLSIILANGRITRPKRFWFDPKITPGSTIFVPVKPAGGKIDWGNAIANATQIVSGLIMSIYVLDKVISE